MSGLPTPGVGMLRNNDVFIQTVLYSPILFLSYLLWTYLRSPLKSIPGPFLAKWTNFWRLIDVWRGRADITTRRLHEKYGSAVRIGPNCVSLSDPSLIKTIYSTKGDWLKTEFYHVNAVLQGGQLVHTMFSVSDPKFHRLMRRPVAHLYSMTEILNLEPLVDKTISKFMRVLEERFMNGPNAEKTCDIDNYLLYYAWDVLGDVTFSQPMGFLEKGGDIDNLLRTADKALDYFAVVGQIPKLDWLFDKNPIVRIGPPSFSSAAVFCVQKVVDRVAGKDSDTHDPSQPDFMDIFLDLRKTKPDIVDDNQVISYLLINQIAGSDTTAITLRAVIYFILKNPQVKDKLLQELDQAALELPAKYRAASQLPYLSACIHEATRMHPGVGLILERYVPAGGLSLPDGRFIQPGTIVGINPWVVAKDKNIYGEDPDSYVPERWLKADGESDKEFEQRLRKMQNADLTFGQGSRICVGKNLALMEVWKVVSTLFSVYDINLKDPKKEWHIQNSWFVRQEGIDVTIRRR
ncbi:MAG: hypothetical protein M1834_009509 [Cirrosporium novae-zelandiae]|nr:MAG: hypothetical protein M1834_009509 [Cirrosporium novae-zelandiae]